MKKWYWQQDCSGTAKRDWWVYGKSGERAHWPDDVTDDWLREFGFSTRAAAIRAAGGNYLINTYKRIIGCRDIDDKGLHYQIYRCYEVVLLDDEGNQVGESEYVYTGRKDAEELGKYKMKMEGC